MDSERPTQHAMIQQEATSRTHVYLFGSERTLVGRVSARSRSSGNPGHSRNSPGVTKRSYDGTVNSISTPRVPRKGSLNDRNLAAFRLP